MALASSRRGAAWRTDIPANVRRHILPPSPLRPSSRPTKPDLMKRSSWLDKLLNTRPLPPQPPEPQPEEEMATMRRIDEESDTGVDGGEEAFGPPAVLLVGFNSDECQQFKELMLEMGADMFKVIPATRAMMKGTLQAALEAEVPPWEQAPLGTRHSIVLSGMFGGEVVDVVGAYRDSGLPSCVFAAAVPNNLSRLLGDLLTEVQQEDVVMRKMAAERAALQQRGSVEGEEP